MIYVAIILILIVCALLVLAILIQNPKGGGLGAGFGTMGNQVMGARRANDFIEKATWSLVVGLLVLCLFSGVAIKKGVAGATQTNSTLDEKIKNNSSGAPVPTQAPPAGGGGTPQGPAQGPPAGGAQPGK